MNDEEIDFFALFGIVWRSRSLVGICIATVVILALAYLRLAPYKYTAELLVTPAGSSTSGGIVSRIGGLGGLASLAGINLGGGQNNAEFELYLENLQSRATAELLAQRVDLMRRIYEREWDPRLAQWHQPSGILRRARNALMALLGAEGQGWHPPDGARLREYLLERVRVIQSTKKQIASIEFSHRDPAFAVELLTALNDIVDESVRRRTLTRASENIAYLSRKLDTVVNVEHRQAIAQALGEQEKLAMMASSNASFAAEPMGNAKASDRPTSPQPIAVILVATILGAAFGSALALGSGVAVRRRQIGRVTAL